MFYKMYFWMLLRTRILKLHSFFVLIRNHKLNIWRYLKHKQIFRKQGKEHVLNIAPTCFLLLLNVYILIAYCNTNLFINIFLFKRHSLPFVLYAYFQPPTFLGRFFLVFECSIHHHDTSSFASNVEYQQQKKFFHDIMKRKTKIMSQ